MNCEQKYIKVLAGIITYNPEYKILEDNLESITKQVSETIIIDNGSENSYIIENLADKYHCLLFKNEQNKGIAYALNQILENANKRGYTWAITLDQDTICPKDLIKKQVVYCTEEKIGIISPCITDRNDNWCKKRKTRDRITYPTWVISSGSLTNVEAWKKIGGFDEKLFIDGVDLDFGLNLHKNGYKIIQISEVSISHAIGEISCHHLGLITIKTKNHSAFRKYYIVRNILILEKKYHQDGNLKMSLRILKQLLLVVFFEKEKAKKIKAITKGIRDGILYNI